MNVQIEDSWKAHLQPEFDKDYFYTLTNFVREEYGKYAIYPPGKLIFKYFTIVYKEPRRVFCFFL